VNLEFRLEHEILLSPSHFRVITRWQRISFGSLSGMNTRASIFWKWVMIISQLLVIGEEIAVRMTPLARQFTGWSAYVATLSLAVWGLLFVGSPFLWRSHRWLAISGLCIAVGWLFVPASSR
jgi:hypothetical protein